MIPRFVDDSNRLDALADHDLVGRAAQIVVLHHFGDHHDLAADQLRSHVGDVLQSVLHIVVGVGQRGTEILAALHLRHRGISRSRQLVERLRQVGRGQRDRGRSLGDLQHAGDRRRPGRIGARRRHQILARSGRSRFGRGFAFHGVGDLHDVAQFGRIGQIGYRFGHAVVNLLQTVERNGESGAFAQDFHRDVGLSGSPVGIAVLPGDHVDDAGNGYRQHVARERRPAPVAFQRGIRFGRQLVSDRQGREFYRVGMQEQIGRHAHHGVLLPESRVAGGDRLESLQDRQGIGDRTLVTSVVDDHRHDFDFVSGQGTRQRRHAVIGDRHLQLRRIGGRRHRLQEVDVLIQHGGIDGHRRRSLADIQRRRGHSGITQDVDSRHDFVLADLDRRFHAVVVGHCDVQAGRIGRYRRHLGHAVIGVFQVRNGDHDVRAHDAQDHEAAALIPLVPHFGPHQVISGLDRGLGHFFPSDEIVGIHVRQAHCDVIGDHHVIGAHDIDPVDHVGDQYQVSDQDQVGDHAHVGKRIQRNLARHNLAVRQVDHQFHPVHFSRVGGRHRHFHGAVVIVPQAGQFHLGRLLHDKEPSVLEGDVVILGLVIIPVFRRHPIGTQGSVSDLLDVPLGVLVVVNPVTDLAGQVGRRIAGHQAVVGDAEIGRRHFPADIAEVIVDRNRQILLGDHDRSIDVEGVQVVGVGLRHVAQPEHGVQPLFAGRQVHPFLIVPERALLAIVRRSGFEMNGRQRRAVLDRFHAPENFRLDRKPGIRLHADHVIVCGAAADRDDIGSVVGADRAGRSDLEARGQDLIQGFPVLQIAGFDVQQITVGSHVGCGIFHRLAVTRVLESVLRQAFGESGGVLTFPFQVRGADVQRSGVDRHLARKDLRQALFVGLFGPYLSLFSILKPAVFVQIGHEYPFRLPVDSSLIRRGFIAVDVTDIGSQGSDGAQTVDVGPDRSNDIAGHVPADPVVQIRLAQDRVPLEVVIGPQTLVQGWRLADRHVVVGAADRAVGLDVGRQDQLPFEDIGSLVAANQLLVILVFTVDKPELAVGNGFPAFAHVQARTLAVIDRLILQVDIQRPLDHFYFDLLSVPFVIDGIGRRKHRPELIFFVVPQYRQHLAFGLSPVRMPVQGIRKGAWNVLAVILGSGVEEIDVCGQIRILEHVTVLCIGIGDSDRTAAVKGVIDLREVLDIPPVHDIPHTTPLNCGLALAHRQASHVGFLRDVIIIGEIDIEHHAGHPDVVAFPDLQSAGQRVGRQPNVERALERVPGFGVPRTLFLRLIVVSFESRLFETRKIIHDHSRTREVSRRRRRPEIVEFERRIIILVQRPVGRPDGDGSVGDRDIARLNREGVIVQLAVRVHQAQGNGARITAGVRSLADTGCGGRIGKPLGAPQVPRQDIRQSEYRESRIIVAVSARHVLDNQGHRFLVDHQILGHRIAVRVIRTGRRDELGRDGIGAGTRDISGHDFFAFNLVDERAFRIGRGDYRVQLGRFRQDRPVFDGRQPAGPGNQNLPLLEEQLAGLIDERHVASPRR